MRFYKFAVRAKAGENGGGGQVGLLRAAYLGGVGEWGEHLALALSA